MEEAFDLAGGTTRQRQCQLLCWRRPWCRYFARTHPTSRRVYTHRSDLKLFFSASNERAERWHFACNGGPRILAPNRPAVPISKRPSVQFFQSHGPLISPRAPLRRPHSERSDNFLGSFCCGKSQRASILNSCHNLPSIFALLLIRKCSPKDFNRIFHRPLTSK